MKFILLTSLIGLFLSPAWAGTAVKLSCSLRQSVTISRFHYKLSTMKWGDHFQVASGMKQAQTKSHVPFRITSFQNGDDLVFFPDSNEYFFFYSGMATPIDASFRRPTPTRLRSCLSIRNRPNKPSGSASSGGFLLKFSPPSPVE
ncbi:Uncharacterised protein [Raoultella terrigena]|uniref:Uncharacterized protein n=1 Tax=Raoultella terrigena TaxID=577 RepID=A0A485AZV3_RAOTE|nr:Uncharacterised protein [Raoultella terrigena]